MKSNFSLILILFFNINVAFSQNVGISTLTPGTTLQVGDLLFGPDSVYITVASQGGNLRRSGIKLHHFNDSYGFTIESDDRLTSQGLNFIRHANNRVGVSAMFIGINGNVGIGSTNPTAPLEVVANNPFGGMVILNNTSPDGFSGQYFKQGDALLGYIGYPSGNYWINPNTFQLASTKGNMVFSVDKNGSHIERMRIDTNGNVGIGTKAPVAKLDVVGNLKIADGTQGPGKVLTSDANGLATWAAPVSGGANTVGPIAGGSNPNGANITGSTLVLTPASENHGGVVTDGTQTFGGSKSFTSDVKINGLTIGRGSSNQASNTVIGFEAAKTINGVNYDNTIIGYTTAYYSSGVGQTAIGKGALIENFASYQTAIGVDAMHKGIGGSGKSTAIGYNAMAYGTGTGENTAIGYNAMTSSTYYNSGKGNTAIGANTIIKDGLFESTAIGYGANVESSQSLVLGHNLIKVGIGTSTPSNRLSVRGNADFIGRLGIGTTDPQHALDVVTPNHTFAARIWNSNLLASNGVALILRGGDATGSGGWLALFQNGNGNEKGSISFNPGGVQYNTTSDVRLKKNIIDSKLGREALKNIQVKDYQYLDNDSITIQGLLAQELYIVYPQAVTKGTDEVDENGKLKRPWMVDYGKLTPLLIKSVQEQQAEIDALKAAYEARLKALEDKLNKVMGKVPLTQ